MSASSSSLSYSRTLSLTLLALFAFAANSLLCRYALLDEAIDASSFTALRLFSGAITLVVLLLVFQRPKPIKPAGNWLAGSMLFCYACAFSFAYTLLGAAMGALILFGVVQISMILFSLRQGQRLHLTEWVGLLLAFFGLVYLVLPGLTAPPLFGSILMVISGLAWATYTIQGQGSSNALADTTFNFIRTLPFIAMLMLYSIDTIMMTTEGVVLAIISGAVTSAIGYAIWYRALRELTSTQAAVVQLLVPVITAFAGVLLLAEPLTWRLTLSSLFILGGIALVIIGRQMWLSLKQT